MSLFSTIKSDEARVLRDAKIALTASEVFVAKIVAAKPAQAVLEAVTAAVAGPAASSVEVAAFNVAGEISKLLTSVNANTNEAALVNLGFDQSVLADIKHIWASVKAL